SSESARGERFGRNRVPRRYLGLETLSVVPQGVSSHLHFFSPSSIVTPAVFEHFAIVIGTNCLCPKRRSIEWTSKLLTRFRSQILCQHSAATSTSKESNAGLFPKLTPCCKKDGGSYSSNTASRA